MARYRQRKKSYTSIYRIAEVLAIIAGIAGIVLAALTLIGGIFDGDWVWDGGIGIQFAGSVILSIVFAVLILLIGLGSIFLDVRGLIIGIIVIILSIFLPGIALILGIVSGVLFIVGDIA